MWFCLEVLPTRSILRVGPLGKIPRLDLWAVITVYVATLHDFLKRLYGVDLS
jgi:hypothetical protein